MRRVRGWGVGRARRDEEGEEREREGGEGAEGVPAAPRFAEIWGLAHTARIPPTQPPNNHRYPTLKKPKWNPPNKVFGPVWAVLYASMGAASWAVSRATKANRGAAVTLYAAQLAFNVS
jgi:hypothetical protein